MGYKRDEFYSPDFDFFHLTAPEFVEKVKELYGEHVEGKEVKPYEYTLITKDGKRIEAILTARLINYQGEKATLGIATDITEHRQAEKALRQSREQLRNLAVHLQSIREEERAAVAREIHDELGQALTALKMDLSWLEKSISKDKKFLSKKTKSMIELVDSTIEKVQRISSELRPGLLDDAGLSAALEWQAEEFQKRTEVICELSIGPKDIALSQEHSTALFRIFQESLTNIARHAEASRVEVSLTKKGSMLKLKVRDNGIGIRKEQVSAPESFGLIGIRERVRFLGGQIDIKGVRNKGTTMSVSIPLSLPGETQ